MTVSAFFSWVNPSRGCKTLSSARTTHRVRSRASARLRSRCLAAKFLIVLAVGLLSAGLADRASAELIAYDQFVGYDPGQLVGQDKGFGWADAWGGDTDYTVSDSAGLTHGALPGVTYGGSARTGSTSGAIRRDLATPLSTPGTYYFGFLLKAAGNAHNAVLGLDEGENTSDNLAYGGAWNSRAFWRLAQKDGSAYSDHNTFVRETANTTLFVMVLELKSSGQDRSKLYVNPANAAGLSNVPQAEHFYTNDFSQVATVRAGLTNQSTSVGSFVFDEIRIGTQAADMFSLIPEPGTLASLALGGLVALRRRRA